MPARTRSASDDIDVSSLGRTVWRSLPRLAILSALIGAGTYGVLSMMAPRYTSEAQLKLSSKRAADSFLRPKHDVNSPETLTTLVDKEAVATEVFALRSRDLATMMVQELRLDRRAEFADPLGSWGSLAMIARLSGFDAASTSASSDDRILEAYYKALQVFPGKDSRAINIVFSAADPQLAANAANKLAELYQRRLAQQSAKQTQGASDFLAKQITRLGEEVRQAHAEVEGFRARAGLLVAGAQNVTLVGQQLAELNTELSRVTAQRSEAEARASAARDMARRGTAEALSDVQRSTLIPRLVEQRVRVERQIAELSATLLAGHPRMKQLRADLVGLNRQISTEVARAVDGLEKEAGVAALREQTARASLENLKRQTVARAGDDVKLRSLEGRARSKRQELDQLQASFEAARTRNDTSAVPLTAELLSRAQPSATPTFPKKAMSAGFAAVASFILGFAFIVTRELLIGGSRPSTPSPRSRSDPLNRRTAPTLRVVEPRLNAGAEATGLSGHATSLVDVAERIVRGGGGQLGYRVLVTAARDGVAIPHQVLELARQLSVDGRHVVVLDWNTKGAGIAAKLGAGAGAGLGELLEGEATFEDAIVPIEKAHGGEIHVIPAGAPMREAIDADRVNLVLDAMDEAYDHVLVHAGRGQAKTLFEAIEGRFDMGLVVLDGAGGSSDDAPGRFLGFSVQDIAVVTVDGAARQLAGSGPAVRQPASASVAQRRMQLAKGMRSAGSVAAAT